MYEFTLGEIFWFEVGYEDIPNESKIRPAVIVDEDDNELLILVATTSVPPHDPPKYFDQFKIPVLNWRKVGLSKPSWVQSLKLIHLTRTQLRDLVKEDDFIGRMSELDFNYLVGEIERIHNDC
ncbi:type II toxin-antitoxin system PemK/MazF family toxin [Desulfosporosinus nitroreducens]|uniref:Type II toxin-antitoxin system PemK/MazF family toxin n=1 Tax=Desulfosporosinus nitroreducens TaxID=2018668 RepID=A0ABT8QVY1_9FIRM|nr:type II toxin-antitoxin system PemK/MazF family toxin [Desulfosporosinus nitroreducens]MCO1604736.1 type II toxin-antitoxin system PemK/MazF family toxin [Desulfosporosinus nitroreducens]MDO0825502.1 type II toxin-antitoxin system PemK/MazF family toxin [Desulfosporosinus nitroreducens]